MDVQILGGHDNVVKDTDLREYDTVSLGDSCRFERNGAPSSSWV